MFEKTIARRIAEWVVSLSIKDIPDEVIEEVKKRFIDTVGVAVGAFYEEPVKIARWLAESSSATRIPATIWGTRKRGTADLVDFANGCACRYFDFNDTYLSKEALHPSDSIPAIIAAAEIVDAPPERVIEGIVAAYEIIGALADAYSVRGRGWDHTVYINIGSAAGAAKVLGLDVDKTEEAINIATNTSLALRQTRAGELSMWKGCAAAHASRNGLFAALLAWKGMTGPKPVFEGEFGFFNVALNGEKFELPPLGKDGYRLMKTSIKYWPVEYHSMSAVEAALKIVDKVGRIDPDQVESVKVETFTVSYKIIVKDPEKWDPKTRETADHSLPYITAAALIDGKIWIDTFKPQRYLAQDVRKLMKKMTIEVNPKYDEIYPEGIGNKIIIKFKDGRVVEEESIYPPGHFKNPMSRSDVEKKFLKITSGLIPEGKAREFLARAWKLEDIEDIGRLIRILVVEE
ncbi:MAG: MmgE/PrpD family protein [Desulfurococcales archaeon]|nr:MmgE/PrpD family protein [Desulfurococcales archaeon]